jgi:hypothetical protein
MFRKLLALPISLLGVLLAHEGAYRLVERNDHERGLLLAHTGHHGWASLIPSIAVIAFLIAAWNAWRQVSSKRRRISFFEIFVTQVIAYCSIEIGERLFSGHNPWPGYSLLIAGIIMQLPSAILVWSLFYFVMVKAAEAVYSSFVYFQVPVNDYSVFNLESDDTYSNYKLTLNLGRAPPLTR